MLSDSLLKMIIPIAEKQLTDDKITPVFEKFLSSYPLEDDEHKNAAICTVEKNGKVYLSVIGMGYNHDIKNYYVTKVKNRQPLIEAIKTLLGHAK